MDTLPHELVEKLVGVACAVEVSRTTSAGGSFWRVQAPSCLVLCVSKSLRRACKPEEIHKTLRDALFWLRVRFLSSAWATIQRAVVTGPHCAATQTHCLWKNNQCMEIASTSEVHMRADGRVRACRLLLNLSMLRATPAGTAATVHSIATSLPKAYATPVGRRTKRARVALYEIQHDMSADLDRMFMTVQADYGHTMFADYADV